jgi:hypothetical protein
MEMNPHSRDDAPGVHTGAGVNTARGHPLACGRTVEQVWEDMEAGRLSAHAAGCLYCTTARASLEQLAQATALLLDEPVDPPAGLLTRIMAAVRADVALGATVPLPAPGGGPSGGVEISTNALAAVLRFAVDGVDGVRAHRCRIEPDPDIPHTVAVWMSVSLRYGSGQVSALDEARRRVGAALSARIGLALSTLDLEVTDVWVDHGDNDRDDTGGGSQGAA